MYRTCETVELLFHGYLVGSGLLLTYNPRHRIYFSSCWRGRLDSKVFLAIHFAVGIASCTSVSSAKLAVIPQFYLLPSVISVVASRLSEIESNMGIVSKR